MIKHFRLVYAVMVVLLFCGSVVRASDPQVSYVTVLQRSGTKLVDIWYGLNDADGDLQNVSLGVSAGGTELTALSFSGDVGEVYPSNNLHVVWDADADWNGNSTTALTVKVTAETVMSASSISNMVFVPAGTNSGLDPSYGGYSLTNTRSFYMDKYEITNDKMVEVLQWAYGQGLLNVSSTTVQNTSGDIQELLDLDDIQCRISWDGTNFCLATNYAAGYPCIEVSWYGAAAFCNYRSAMEGLAPSYDFSDWSVDANASGYRLPFSDEWEYAARGGVEGQRFPWGQEINHDYANYMANSNYYYDTSPYSNNTYHPLYYDGNANVSLALGTSPVGSFEAGRNEYGLYDMAGNVWEWCYEWYPGYENLQRIRRGGCWRCTAPSCRSGNVYRLDPPHSGHHVGFRTLLPYAGIAASESAAVNVDTTGPSRVIAVSSSVTFSDTVVGGTSTADLTISNSGDGDLQVLALVCSAPFSGYWSGVIAAGASTNISVSFSPADVTNYMGEVSVLSDATSGSGNSKVSGVGIPPAANDFDGDGVSDLAVYRPSSQRWYISLSGGGDIRGRKWGISGDIPMAVDYDGDGTSDIAVYRPDTGWWFGMLSNGGYLRSKWGIQGDKSVPADYDGDGISDLAIFRVSSSFWYVNESGSGNKDVCKWGIAGDVPVPGDYDGDGKADHAIFRYGGWWAISATASGVLGKTKWGIAGDEPLPADYDGDGADDLCVYRPSTGWWYMKCSSDATVVSRKWGIAGDVPVPGDYDGDGLADLCVYRPSTGWWYILRSSDGGVIKSKWGIPGDEPVSVQYQLNRMLP